MNLNDLCWALGGYLVGAFVCSLEDWLRDRRRPATREDER